MFAVCTYYSFNINWTGTTQVSLFVRLAGSMRALFSNLSYFPPLGQPILGAPETKTNVFITVGVAAAV